MNGSISINLDGLTTRTSVSFQPYLPSDELTINGDRMSGAVLERVSIFMDRVRSLAKTRERVQIISENNFPAGAGIASSASAFAALSLAGSTAAGLKLSERDLSRLARRGSGSAARSIPNGFVEWLPGTSDDDSFAISIAPPKHWALTDCIALISAEQKKTGSTEGHGRAGTSPLQAARVADTPRRLEICRRAINERDFDALASIIELDSDMMHSVMMTSSPPLHYWQSASVTVMQTVRSWRTAGIPACYSVDAGANVHVLCPEDQAGAIAIRLGALEGVRKVLTARVGGPARLIDIK